MATLHYGNSIVTYYPAMKICRGFGRYVYLDFHPFGGPTFYVDKECEIPIDSSKISKSVWKAFQSWYDGQRRCKDFGHARSCWDGKKQPVKWRCRKWQRPAIVRDRPKPARLHPRPRAELRMIP